MKRLLTLCIVLTAVALIAAPAFAEVQNVKVSGDVKVMGIYRDSFDLNDNEAEDQTAWYQSIARIQIDADLTDNVSTCVRILNERDWDTETVAGTDMDLDLANITLKEFFFAPLTVIIGRQELRYGNAMVVGNVSQNADNTGSDNSITGDNYSVRNAFDAIRGIIELDNLTIDIFTAKINDATTTDSAAHDNDLYGIDVSTTLENDAVVAGYVILANDNQTAVADTNEEIWTVGVRGAMSLTDAVDASLEIALQTGDYSTIRNQQAWAVDAAIDYALNANMNPVLGLSYIYRSGDKAGASATDDQEAWTPLYEDQTNGLIADFLFDGLNGGVNSNCHIINVSAVFEPIEDLTASINYYQYILDEKLEDGTEATLWSGAGSSEVTADDDLGSEIDLALNYAYTEDVSFGLTSAWFLPGDLFKSANNDTATEVVGSVSVSF